MKLLKKYIGEKRQMGKLEQNKGFVLCEFLIVVSILSLVLGASALFIANWETSRKMKELDATAKTIYIELQNQFVEMKAEGRFGGVYEQIQKDSPERFLKTMPKGYDVDEEGDSWKQLCYVQKEDTITKMIVKKNMSTYQVSGDYLVELNPASGEVYGVFYSDQSKPIDYQTVNKLKDRTVKEREKKQLGYYGGNIEDRALSKGLKLEQKVELINSEELYLKITLKENKKVLANQDALSIDLTIADEHGNKWFQKDVNKSATKLNEDGLSFYILLDSMQNGSSFLDITEKKLVPGDNISITVESEFSKGFSRCVEVSNVKGNSLFAQKQDAAGTLIKVSTLRHMRNLDSRYYSQEQARLGESIRIIQENDIDFENLNFAWQDGKYKGKGKAIRPISEMEPIQNETILSNSGEGTDIAEYDGNGFLLKNFIIQASTDNVGVFATAKNVIFRNVKIEDAMVTANDHNNVGGLVGTTYGGEVIDCSISLEQFTGEGTDKKYYVHQPANNKEAFENRMQEKVATMRISGGKNVGGLIGSAEGTVISRSNSTVSVFGRENVGGFIGNAIGVKVLASSSTGDVHASSNRGELFGYQKDVHCENSFGHGKVTND